MSQTKQRNRIAEAVYYANPHNLSREVAKLGYTLSVKKTAVSYVVYMVAAFLAGWMFELKPVPMIILILSGIFFIPVILRNSYKNMYEQHRFSEVTEYMEHMLYSFRANHKILQSLNEVELSFRQGPMYETIQEAKKEILTGSGRGGVEKNGLKVIEKRYDCERLRAMHKFMIEVEYLGGNFDESIDLLLEDRMTWVDRTTAFQKDKKKQIFNIGFSIAVSALICLVIQRALPSQINIAENILVQIVTLILLVMDITLYAVADSRMATDWLETKHTLSDEQTQTYYKRVVNYDEEASKKKALVMAAIFLVLSGGLALVTKPYMAGVGIVFALFAFFKPQMSYKSAKRALETEIAVKFPQWLMGISLQLQSENVQMAVFNSIPGAPMVLKPELIKLREKLNNAPESVLPYLEFMQDFDVPEIQSSMKMLYSISAGTGGDSGKQIAEIIRRNNLMLDKSEKNAFENVLAGLYGMFLAPQIVGGAKLLTDMIIFFVIFMGQLQM